MQISIRYASKGGHTRALAQALASALGIKAELAGVPVEDADVLFVGSAVYAYGIDPSVKQLILGLDPAKVRRIAVFGNAALAQGRVYAEIKSLAERRGLKVDPDYYSCKGEFGFLHKGHPDQDDLKMIAAWGRTFLDPKEGT